MIRRPVKDRKVRVEVCEKGTVVCKVVCVVCEDGPIASGVEHCLTSVCHINVLFGLGIKVSKSNGSTYNEEMSLSSACCRTEENVTD